ncbi:MAG: taurine dioxygenase [Ilumatobacteraceae bacterium]|nr:taurine dioxygenase [Ilumatobacteraceae bacterium]
MSITITEPSTVFHPGPHQLVRTPVGWQDLPYTRFTLQPLSPTIGAVVSGVSMADAVDAEMFGELNRALLEWKVLFFRNQHITPAEHATFASNWGALESHPFIKHRSDQPEDMPEVVRLAKGPKMAGYENTWHSDVTWRLTPSLGSVLRAVEVPEVGGDTLWADMGAAYDGLSDATKERIDGLLAEHDWINSFGRGMDPATRDALRPDFPAVHHPVVRTHPETGRKTLYVNQAFTQHIVGMDPDESRDLLEHLYLRAAYPEFQCRFHWQAGDVAFWDNRSTQHYATSDYFPQTRVMERITVVGDRPV